jgi:hypothetical protein
MPAEDGYKIAVVIVDRHEPEGETAGRLLEIAEEKGYSPRVVEAARGDHDAALSFRVPRDVAEAFEADRAERWPDDSAKRAELGVNVDGSRRTERDDADNLIENDPEKAARREADADTKTTAEPKARTAKAQKE